jgi:competence protein ComEC
LSRFGAVAIDRNALEPFFPRHHVGLLDVLDRYRVGAVYTTGVEYSSVVSEEFEKRLLPVPTLAYVTEPTTLSLAPSLRLHFLHPTRSVIGERLEDVNKSSIVLLVEHAAVTLLLTGEITTEEEHALLNLTPSPPGDALVCPPNEACHARLAEVRRLLTDIDLLKVSHHGSASSSSGEFLTHTLPDVAIISVGENDYGHPHPVVLQRLYDVGAAIWRTDRLGDIRVQSDGDALRIRPLAL